MASVTEFAREHGSQSHLCICNTALFDATVRNGVYGFPHSGESRQKSFWRSIASMYNFGPDDLVFLYRTNGDEPGCQEIHGPFRIHTVGGFPAIYYDLDSQNLPMKVKGEADCKVRFLFAGTTNTVFSIADNYELIKRYETKDIWGYRHPAVMNIGAARKKSVTSFTSKQTLTILALIREFGRPRMALSHAIPAQSRVEYYHSLPGDRRHYRLDDGFLLAESTGDEAFLYAYILRGLKNPASALHATLMTDLAAVNDPMLKRYCGKTFRELAANVMTETIISPHLQEELDIVLMDQHDAHMMFMEIKTGHITQEDVVQAQKYLDLLGAIFPARTVSANVIGLGKLPGLTVAAEFQDRLNLVSYNRDQTGKVAFIKM